MAKFKPPCKGRKMTRCGRAPKSCRSTKKTSKRRSYCRKPRSKRSSFSLF